MTFQIPVCIISANALMETVGIGKDCREDCICCEQSIGTVGEDHSGAAAEEALLIRQAEFPR